jgi:hypothetical protein
VRFWKHFQNPVLGSNGARTVVQSLGRLGLGVVCSEGSMSGKYFPPSSLVAALLFRPCHWRGSSLSGRLDFEFMLG